MEKGLIHIYTGEGKGKTTAAIGLAVRAKGKGLNVLFIQFLKGSAPEDGEAAMLQELSIKFVRFKDQIKPLFDSTVKEGDLKAAVRMAIEFTISEMKSGRYDLVILDEFNNLFKGDLITMQDARRLISEKPEEVELVLTGRGVPDEMKELADYVTEMRMIKHPYQKGISARKGIEY